MRTPSPNSQSVQLTADEVQELNHKLATLRHDINNSLSLMIAASELIRHKPQIAPRMLETLIEQPPKITAALAKFSADFEHAFGIKRH